MLNPATVDEDPGDCTHAGVGREGLAVALWRRDRLVELGLSKHLATLFADSVDWHSFARLVGRGCAPLTALEIVR